MTEAASRERERGYYARSEGGFELGRGARIGIDAEYLVRGSQRRRHPIFLLMSATAAAVRCASALESPQSATATTLQSANSIGRRQRRRTNPPASRHGAAAQRSMRRDRTGGDPSHRPSADQTARRQRQMTAQLPRRMIPVETSGCCFAAINSHTFQFKPLFARFV